MAEAKARVRNAADAEQVRSAREQEQFDQDEHLNDLRQVLGTYEGRRERWALLERCGVFSSVYADGPAIYFNAGRQDLGKALMAEIIEAQPDFYLLMQGEAIDQKKKQIEPKSKKAEETDGN